MLSELRDRLAGLCGWKYGRCECWLCKNLSDEDASGWVRPSGTGLTGRHPFPAGDLTALAAAWPEGWWCNVDFCPDGSGMPWCVNGGIADSEREYDAPTEYEARLRLTVAVLEAVEGS